MLTQPADPCGTDLHLASPDAMTAFGYALEKCIGPGDLVTLTGPLGAGKSHLARAIIRAKLASPEADVPSPTYTLVNVYQAGTTEIWHADLYRLSDPEDLVELGLDDALDHALTLVEWPDRWTSIPSRRLEIAIQIEPDETRSVALNPKGAWPRLSGFGGL